MPSTQIILTENIPGLGAEADVVKVRRGFARNFLLPQGKAYEVTPASMRKLDMLKAKRAEREAKELNDAEEIARRIGKSKVIFTLETGESGKAFGSVTANDIATRLKNEVGADIERHRIVLEHPIKSTGEHEISNNRGRTQLAGGRSDPHLVLVKRSPLVVRDQALRCEPQCGFSLRESLLTVDPPAPEASVSEGV